MQKYTKWWYTTRSCSASESFPETSEGFSPVFILIDNNKNNTFQS